MRKRILLTIGFMISILVWGIGKVNASSENVYRWTDTPLRGIDEYESAIGRDEGVCTIYDYHDMDENIDWSTCPISKQYTFGDWTHLTDDTHTITVDNDYKQSYIPSDGGGEPEYYPIYIELFYQESDLDDGEDTVIAVGDGTSTSDLGNTQVSRIYKEYETDGHNGVLVRLKVFIVDFKDEDGNAEIPKIQVQFTDNEVDDVWCTVNICFTGEIQKSNHQTELESQLEEMEAEQQRIESRKQALGQEISRLRAEVSRIENTEMPLIYSIRNMTYEELRGHMEGTEHSDYEKADTYFKEWLQCNIEKIAIAINNCLEEDGVTEINGVSDEECASWVNLTPEKIIEYSNLRIPSETMFVDDMYRWDEVKRYFTNGRGIREGASINRSFAYGYDYVYVQKYSGVYETMG